MREPIEKFDENNNSIYYKNLYDSWEYWAKYDENNNLIYFKNSNGEEYWYKYNEKNSRIFKIKISEKEYKNIEFRKVEKEYNSRTKCSRFEIMDI